MSYGLDLAGNRIKLTWPDNNFVNYDYDGLNRLTKIREMGAASSARAYVPDGLNRYTTVAGTTYGYDLRGNLTSDGSRTFTYDVENRLLSVTGSASATCSGWSPSIRAHSARSIDDTAWACRPHRRATTA